MRVNADLLPEVQEFCRQNGLLPEGGCGSVSTVPLAYKSLNVEEGVRKAPVCVRQVAVMAEYLDSVRKEEGREIVLINPEGKLVATFRPNVAPGEVPHVDMQAMVADFARSVRLAGE